MWDGPELQLCLKKEVAQPGWRIRAGTSGNCVPVAPTPSKGVLARRCWLSSTDLRPPLGPEMAWCFCLGPVVGGGGVSQQALALEVQGVPPRGALSGFRPQSTQADRDRCCCWGQ